MKSAIKSESEIRKLLRGLSDTQVKKLVNSIDISPFPILLASEYERRFGSNRNSTGKLLNKIRAQIIQEQKNQFILLNRIKKEIDLVKNARISESGLDNLSEYSITKIQNRRSTSLAKLHRYCELLSKSTRKTESLETRYTRLNNN
ncbi:MAG TPA: hypothetical protein VFW99_00505 [Candidatus Nitrosotalea sp.]|nr:hypothetical protein [Candidatus Nitrosotalea sp.]